MTILYFLIIIQNSTARRIGTAVVQDSFGPGPNDRGAGPAFLLQRLRRGPLVRGPGCVLSCENTDCPFGRAGHAETVGRVVDPDALLAAVCSGGGLGDASIRAGSDLCGQHAGSAPADHSNGRAAGDTGCLSPAGHPATESWRPALSQTS